MKQVIFTRGLLFESRCGEFLSTLGGLIITHEAYSDINDKDVSVFDPSKLTAWIDPTWVKECYEDIIKEKL